MTDDNTPTTIEAPELHETHATNFKIITNNKELVLIAGERQITLDKNGDPDASRIEVDTKIRMDHQTAYELLQGLEGTLGNDSKSEVDREPSRSVH